MGKVKKGMFLSIFIILSFFGCKSSYQAIENYGVVTTIDRKGMWYEVTWECHDPKRENCFAQSYHVLEYGIDLEIMDSVRIEK